MDVIKDLYDAELSRREQLISAVPLPVGILTLLGSLLLYMLREFSWPGHTITQWSFLTAATLCAICILCSITYLIRSYIGNIFRGQATQYVAKADELLGWIEDLEKHYREHGSPVSSIEEQVSKEVKKQLRSLFSAAAAYNAQVNDRRSELLFRANRLLAISLLLAILTAIPYTADTLLTATSNERQQTQAATSPTAAP